MSVLTEGQKSFFRRRSGAVLILVMLLIAALFTLSAGFLSKKTSEHKAVKMASHSLQAREIAYAGLESVRVRLLNDGKFPPSNLNAIQHTFSFTEAVKNLDETAEIGRYQVHCDRRWVAPPYSILRVTIVGQVEQTANPVRYKLTGEFLLAAGKRGDLVNLVDNGSF